MPVPQILIVADDLTGAADTGVAFARAGWLTMVGLAPGAHIPESDALVVSAESRDCSPEVAIRRVQCALPNLKKLGKIPYVYKKIDSTLRGHPAAELEVVMDSLGLKQALVAPAFPAQGRTTRRGRQLLDGVPLEHTRFGHDILSSDLRVLFQTREGMACLVELDIVRRGPDALCEALGAFGGRLVVADAETDADLAVIAGAGLRYGVRLWCGSAGLARALSNVLPPPANRASAPAIPSRPAEAVLVVAGSRHPSTARQVDVAQGWGAALVSITPEAVRGREEAIERAIKLASRRLGDGEHVILTSLGLDDSSLDGQSVARCLAQITRTLVYEGLAGGLVLSGGQVAASVCSALEASALWLRGETQPGIAWGILVGGLAPGLPVITKAGGFGRDEALALAIKKLANYKAGRVKE
ncbi:MAG: D-threonate kinase [Anaerolineae bacterium]